MENKQYDAGCESIRLANQLCFPLYACAKEVIRQYRRPLEALDLTYTQYITMMVLWEESCVSVKELGQKLFERGARGIELTEKGVALKRRADDLVDLAERIEAEIKSKDSMLTKPILSMSRL